MPRRFAERRASNVARANSNNKKPSFDCPRALGDFSLNLQLFLLAYLRDPRAKS